MVAVGDELGWPAGSALYSHEWNGRVQAALKVQKYLQQTFPEARGFPGNRSAPHGR